jgi:hypothetical protein
MPLAAYSEHVQDADYDPDTQELTVTFRADGAQYVYYDVPLYVYNALAVTQWPGGFFRSVIKGKYRSAGPF